MLYVCFTRTFTHFMCVSIYLAGARLRMPTRWFFVHLYFSTPIYVCKQGASHHVTAADAGSAVGRLSRIGPPAAALRPTAARTFWRESAPEAHIPRKDAWRFE